MVTIKSLVTGYSSALRFSNPQGIFFDRKFKELYVCDAGNHQVVIFDSTGYPIFRFKHWVEQEGKRILGEPRSMVVNAEGDIFLTDNLADYIDVLDHRGESEDQIDLAKLLHLSTAKPDYLALDGEEHLYVGYRGEKSEVAVLDRGYQVIRQLKNQPDNHQDFESISGLWVDAGGKIYVTDVKAEPCVKVFSNTGVYLFGFGRHEVGWGDFSLPAGVATTTDGTIWIVDTFQQVVKAFNSKGEFIQYIGGYGRHPGDMKYPDAIAGDGDQTIFVLERVGERYQEFVVQTQVRQ